MYRRTPRTALLLLVLPAVIALGACGSSSSSTKTTSNPPAGSASATTAAANATVQVRNNPTLGNILVDANGMTLYHFDPENSGTIVCAAGWTPTWPPLTVTATPTAGPGVGHTIGEITRPDGSTQVTADKWPLYHFAADKAPGDTMGNGIAGKWHVVMAGSAAATPAATPTTAATGYGGY